MGYEVGVTPLQMAVAASAVANGGELVTPRIVRAVIDGDRRQPVPRKVIRRVVSPETAAELTSMMEGVVERGTAQRASLAGFTVAGKTGTATKNQNGRYLKDDVNASFVGFVPSRQPALTILVVIDTPRGPNHAVSAARSRRRSSTGSPTPPCATSASRPRSTRRRRCCWPDTTQGAPVRTDRARGAGHHRAGLRARSAPGRSSCPSFVG